jgi:cytochrome c oxidase subunit II
MIFVAGYVIYFAIAFRARASDAPDTIGVQVHDAPTLELWWTIIPTVLLIVLTAISINVWYKVYFGTTAPALTMEVIGHQFYFEYRYPGMKTSVFSKTEPMHLPVGVPVRLLITSTDVIHQFWVPEIRVKAAAVPGLVQNLNFTPLRTGTFDIACSEFCGVDHALMRGKLVIEPVVAFNKWMAGENVAAAHAGGATSLAGGDPNAGGLPSGRAVRSEARRSGPVAYHRRSGASDPGHRQTADARRHRRHPAERLYRTDRIDAQPSSQRPVRQRYRKPRSLSRQPQVA